MRILAVGDLHFRSKKLKDIQTAWKNTIQWAQQNKVDLIVQAGDCFDAANVYGREFSTGTIYNAFLEPFADNPIKLFLIPGNHDIGSPRDKDALAPIDRYDWITVVRKPTFLEVQKGFSICAVPWLNRLTLVSKFLSKGMDLKQASARVNEGLNSLMGKLAAGVKQHKEKGNFVLFVGHIEVTGASIGSITQVGGSFEFSPTSLAEVGADLYALGHLHQRQAISGLPNPNDGYLGTLCQLNFGEEQYKSGTRFIEVENGKVKEDRWIDNTESPRYFTVKDIKDAPYRPGIDYVKVRGTEKPANLPEGVIFEKVPMAQIRPREDSLLGADSSIKDLLQAWQKTFVNTIPVEKLLEKTTYLQNACVGKFCDAIGTLDCVHSIVLKNITCHKETKLSLPPGICAMAGPNGSGKTTAVEALMLALYGTSPSRSSISSLVPSNAPDASVEVVFSSGGKKYTAKRDFIREDKKIIHKAVIFQSDTGDSIAVGPENCLKFIKNLVGDPKLVLAGVFSSQGDGDNLVKQDPAERQRLFAKLLGTEKFLQWADVARKQSVAENAIIDAKKKHYEHLERELAGEKEEKESRIKRVKDLGVKEKEQTELQDDIKGLVEQISKLEAHKQEIERRQKELEQWKAKVESVKVNGRALKQKKIAIESFDGEDLEKKIIEAKAWQTEAIRLGNEALQTTMKHFEAKQAVEVFEQERNKEAQKLINEKSELNHLYKTLVDKIEEAQRRSKLLGNFPDIDACKKCPLAADGIASRESIASLQEKFNKVKIESQILDDKVIKFNADTETQKLEKIAKIPSDSNDLVEQKNALLEKAAILPQLEEKDKRYQHAKAEVGKIDALLEVERQNLKDAQAQVIKASEEIEKIGAFNIPAYQKCLSDKKIFEERIVELSSEINTLNRSIGENDAKLKRYENIRVEMLGLSEELNKTIKEVEILDTLAMAYSREGIPQIIVDSAIPHLQDIMFKMLSEIEGRWSVKVSTQHETKSGTTQERIDILIDDGTEERDISTYSGGEMNLLSTVVRVAFSVLQAERSGRGIKVLVLDECMYFADAEYAEAFVKMLQNLTKYFKQIFVVSHSDSILASIRNKIFFTRLPGNKTTIECDFEESVL